jgi:molybdate transport system regulatory protein
MNTLIGHIKNIQSSGAILLIDIEAYGQDFSAILINSGSQVSSYSIGQEVNIVFKETEVSLAKNLSGKISLRNRIQCIVQQIERGEILSKITLQFQNQTITSIITTRSVDAMQINVNEHIEAMIKANEIQLITM